MFVGASTSVSSIVIGQFLGGIDIVEVLHPPTHEFLEATADSTALNDAYNASDNNIYVIDFVIADPSTAPVSNETIFYHGVGFNNYVWLRRRDTGSLQLVVRSGNNTKIDFSFKEEMQYINKTMRLAVALNDDDSLDVYINGRRWSHSTTKVKPLTNSSTRAEFNAVFSTDVASSDGVRMRYYDVAKTREEMELITDVSLKELGLSYTYEENALGIVGQGQSQMSGAEDTTNKTIMPEVANNRLNMINVNGDYEDFTESWYDPGIKQPLFRSFSQTFAGNGFAYLAGYMGRVGNDIAAKQNRNVVVTCAAASGTKISNDWAGARTDLNGQGTGTTEAIGYMTFGIFESIRQMKAKCREVIVVHDQGQGDALDGMSQADYETQLNAQLDWIDYYHPDVFHYIVGFNEFNAASTILEADWDNINAARRAVAESRVNCAFIDVSNITIVNPDGLHYLNANQEIVGNYIAKTYYGGETNEWVNPSFGETVLTGTEPWNNKQEGFIIVSYNTSQQVGNEYLVHLNDGGSSPATGMRTLAGTNTIGQLYRDDSGNVIATTLNGTWNDDQTYTYAYTWSNRMGSTIQIGNEGVIEFNTFTPDDATFATDTWSRLRIGERNSGSEPYTGDLYYIQIGDTYLDSSLLAKKMNDAPKINLMSGGQSLAREYFNSTDGSVDDGVVEILNQMRLAFPEQEVVAFDGAEGGSTVSELSYEEFWWNPLRKNNNRGPELQDFHDVRITNGVKDPFIWWDLGITDSHYIDMSNEVTFSDFKRDMLRILFEIRKQEPNAKFGIILQARRTVFGNTGYYQRIRDFYIDLINTYDWIYRLPDVYDIDLFDAVHHTDAGIVLSATRIGRKIASILGASLTGVDGPAITSVSRFDKEVTINLTHDNGSDITPATGEIQGFQYHVDEASTNIETVSRLDGDTITMTLETRPSGSERLYYAYDAMTDVDDLTRVVRDNSTPAMALEMINFSSITNEQADIATLNIACIGDSTAERMFTQFGGAGATAFNTQIDLSNNGTNTFYERANSGTFLLESTALSEDVGNTNRFWVDDSGALADGPQLDNNVVDDTNSPRVYICSLGINDNLEITPTSTTVSEIESAYSYIASRAIATQSVDFMMLNPIGRAASSSGDDVGCNVIREGIHDAIENDANIKRGVDTYDLERIDAKHLTQSGDEEKGKREAIQVAHHLKTSEDQGIGPAIISAELKTDEIQLNLRHTMGTDIVAPTAGAGGIDATDDGTAMGATTLTRVDARTALLSFGEGSAPLSGSEVKLYTPYGKDGNGLALVPDVMKDNSSLALPIQSSVITVTNSDPVQALDNVVTYFDARGSAKTIENTDEVPAVTAITGASLSEVDPDDHFTYDSSGLGGVGTLKYTATTQMLYTGFTAGNTHTIAVVFEHPNPIGNSEILFFANSSGGTDNQAKITQVSGDSRLYWSLNEGDVSEAISDANVAGQKTVVIFEFVDATTLNVYHDGETVPSYTIDPRDDFNAWDSILLGARTAGSENGAYVDLGIGAYLHTTDVLTSQEKTDIFNYWNTRFALGL